MAASFNNNVLFSILVITIVQLAYSYPAYQNKAVQEAEIIALEQSNFIVPVQPLVNKIMHDLNIIRNQYNEVRDVTIKRKWVPGQVNVRSITDDQINRIDSSVYGPLVDVRQYGSAGTVLVFSKSYHPEVLSQRLHEKFNVNAEPITTTPNGNGHIAYMPREKIYRITKGPVFSYPGYSSNYVYDFQVVGDNVKLMKTVTPGAKL